jgi:hypothetical protein
MRRLGLTLLLLFFGLRSALASVPSPAPSAAVVPLFSIAKSENKNQVQYAVRLDDRCAPVGTSPVFAYWRMFEKGPLQTAPLLSREVRAYGLSSQALVAADASGGRLRAVLMALPSRPLTITTSRGSDGKCQALTTAWIAGASATLFNVYVHLRWYGVDYVLLRGWPTDGSHVVSEKLAM